MISVIIPIYNSENTIVQCLESIFSKGVDLEIILVNDGSTDGSLLLCQQQKEKYSNIEIITQRNQGVSAARNAGIKKATGEWICFVDSDDCVLPGYFEQFNSLQDMAGIDIVICGYKNKNGVAEEKEYLSGEIVGADELRRNVLGNKEYGGFCWNKFYRKNIIEENHILFDAEIKMCEDVLFTMDYLQYVTKGYLNPQKMYLYNCTEVGTRYSWKKVATAVRAYEKMIDGISVDENSKQIMKYNLAKHCIRTAIKMLKEGEKKEAIKEYIVKIQNGFWDIMLCREIDIKWKVCYIILAIFV